ncbi:MAG TPA: hypothetical protein VFA21_18885 [Pyrinomonadaceae bacterium]|nr:hypothetical protein [Pyrinomonadaceae bacterium]
MACGYTRDDIEEIVVNVYSGILKDPSLTKDSRFGMGNEIPIDDNAKRLFFFPIEKSVDRVPDCILKKFSPDVCQKAKTIGDVIDAICKEFKIK